MVQILLCMAEQIAQLTAYVGSGERAYLLLSPLEQLVAVEDSLVRHGGLELAEKLKHSCLY